MVVTLMSRLSIGLLIVILVGVTLVVAWPVILIGAMMVVLSKGTESQTPGDSRSNRNHRVGGEAFAD
jgi:hypothetical protein